MKPVVTHAAWPLRLRVGGFAPFSTVDWPGRLAAVVFLSGCPWRCGYCHNPDLQDPQHRGDCDWASIEARLARRRGLLDAVVFSGGEPTADSCLPAAIARVRELGFAVGLHTAGIHPARLAAVLPALDWVGFDLKTSFAGYDALTGVRGSAARVRTSAEQLVASGVAHEFRLTWHGALMQAADVETAAHYAASLGVRHFALQAYRARPGSGAGLPADTGIPTGLAERLAPLFTRFEVRD